MPTPVLNSCVGCDVAKFTKLVVAMERTRTLVVRSTTARQASGDCGELAARTILRGSRPSGRRQNSQVSPRAPSAGGLGMAWVWSLRCLRRRDRFRVLGPRERAMRRHRGHRCLPPPTRQMPGEFDKDNKPGYVGRFAAEVLFFCEEQLSAHRARVCVAAAHGQDEPRPHKAVRSSEFRQRQLDDKAITNSIMCKNDRVCFSMISADRSARGQWCT